MWTRNKETQQMPAPIKAKMLVTEAERKFLLRLLEDTPQEDETRALHE